MNADERELDIADVAYGGRGVGRDAGMAVFVPGALPGERVRVRLTARHTRFAEAELCDVLTPAPARRPPGCPLCDPARPPAQRCPGCRYQHVAYAEEVRIKERQLGALLARIGGFAAPPLEPAFAAPEPLGYRNKLVLHAGPGPVLGYVAEDNRSLVDVPDCPLAVSAIRVELARRRAEPDTLRRLPAGTAVTFRYTAHDGVSVRPLDRARPDMLTESTVLGALWAPARSFFQVHRAVADALALCVRDALDPARDTTAVDLYGGVGLFAFAATQAGCARVYTADRDPAAVDAARRNAAALGLPVTGLVMDARAGLRHAVRDADPAHTAVIADPPRRGLEPDVLDTLLRLRPRRILMLSCAPDTLARDLKRLARGYTLESVRAFDMFPRTAAFECLAVLTAHSGGGPSA
jgi:23S rRNA (uracil1939-C5)-methyltransferase